jgi:hypothetical protein
MERLAVRSDAVIVKQGEILTYSGGLIGDWLREGDECEDGFKRKAKEKNIVINVDKPLHPMIKWALDEKGNRTAIVSLNYLAKLGQD